LKGVIALPLTNVPEEVTKPDVEGTLVVIESSAECAIGQKVNITDEIAERLRRVNSQRNSLRTYWKLNTKYSTLKAFGQRATIDGGANVSLKGAHEGLKWSGLAA